MKTMPDFKKTLFFFLLTVQYINILCNENNFLSINEADQEVTNFTKTYRYNYNYSNIEEKNILHIVATTSKFSVPTYIYASYYKNISEDNRMFSSQDLGHNHLYIKLRDDKTDLYMSLSCPKKDKDTNIKIKASLISKIEKSEDIPKAKFKLDHDFTLYYKVPENPAYEMILLYAHGEDWDFFENEGLYENSLGINENLEFRLLLETGYGAVINLREINASKKIIINLIPIEKREGRKVEVGFEPVDSNITYQRK
jgi:hypothetical protein